MEPPALLLQLLRRQVLLICPLGVVEDEEQTINAGLFVKGRIVEGRCRNRRIRRGGRVRILRLVRALPLSLIGSRHIEERVLQATEVAPSGIGTTAANSGTAGLTRSNGRGGSTTNICTTTQRKTAEAGSRSQKTTKCSSTTGGRLLLSLELSRLLLKELLLLSRRCRRLMLFSLLLLGLLPLEELGLLLLYLELLLLLHLLLPQELGLLLGLLFLEQSLLLLLRRQGLLPLLFLLLGLALEDGGHAGPGWLCGRSRPSLRCRSKGTRSR
mmetsp:Transcript_29453/g.69080  ORF Transcript_29453/g.69080 Transcript_29453/m.69080 type:complete len:270 (+) Transcript_29453:385-1194(+)